MKRKNLNLRRARKSFRKSTFGKRRLRFGLTDDLKARVPQIKELFFVVVVDGQDKKFTLNQLNRNEGSGGFLAGFPKNTDIFLTNLHGFTLNQYDVPSKNDDPLTVKTGRDFIKFQIPKTERELLSNDSSNLANFLFLISTAETKREMAEEKCSYNLDRTASKADQKRKLAEVVKINLCAAFKKWMSLSDLRTSYRVKLNKIGFFETLVPINIETQSQLNTLEVIQENNITNGFISKLTNNVTPKDLEENANLIPLLEALDDNNVVAERLDESTTNKSSVNIEDLVNFLENAKTQNEQIVNQTITPSSSVVALLDENTKNKIEDLATNSIQNIEPKSVFQNNTALKAVGVSLNFLNGLYHFTTSPERAGEAVQAGAGLVKNLVDLTSNYTNFSPKLTNTIENLSKSKIKNTEEGIKKVDEIENVIQTEIIEQRLKLLENIEVFVQERNIEYNCDEFENDTDITRLKTCLKKLMLKYVEYFENKFGGEKNFEQYDEKYQINYNYSLNSLTILVQNIDKPNIILSDIFHEIQRNERVFMKQLKKHSNDRLFLIKLISNNFNKINGKFIKDATFEELSNAAEQFYQPPDELKESKKIRLKINSIKQKGNVDTNVENELEQLMTKHELSNDVNEIINIENIVDNVEMATTNNNVVSKTDINIIEELPNASAIDINNNDSNKTETVQEMNLSIDTLNKFIDEVSVDFDVSVSKFNKCIGIRSFEEGKKCMLSFLDSYRFQVFTLSTSYNTLFNEKNSGFKEINDHYFIVLNTITSLNKDTVSYETVFSKLENVIIPEHRMFISVTKKLKSERDVIVKKLLEYNQKAKVNESTSFEQLMKMLDAAREEEAEEVNNNNKTNVASVIKRTSNIPLTNVSSKEDELPVPSAPPFESMPLSPTTSLTSTPRSVKKIEWVSSAKQTIKITKSDGTVIPLSIGESIEFYINDMKDPFEGVIDSFEELGNQPIGLVMKKVGNGSGGKMNQMIMIYDPTIFNYTIPRNIGKYSNNSVNFDMINVKTYTLPPPPPPLPVVTPSPPAVSSYTPLTSYDPNAQIISDKLKEMSKRYKEMIGINGDDYTVFLRNLKISHEARKRMFYITQQFVDEINDLITEAKNVGIMFSTKTTSSMFDKKHEIMLSREAILKGIIGTRTVKFGALRKISSMLSVSQFQNMLSLSDGNQMYYDLVRTKILTLVSLTSIIFSYVYLPGQNNKLDTFVRDAINHRGAIAHQIIIDDREYPLITFYDISDANKFDNMMTSTSGIYWADLILRLHGNKNPSNAGFFFKKFITPPILSKFVDYFEELEGEYEDDTSTNEDDTNVVTKFVKWFFRFGK